MGSVWAERDGKQVVRSVLSQACCRLVDTLAVVYQAFVSAFSSHHVQGLSNHSYLVLLAKRYASCFLVWFSDVMLE